MAGVAEKARFFLERTVPQLREWEEKEIFTTDEIRNIVQKRNDFEHKVLSPGNKPSDWAKYAQWEQSLEILRNKRCKRLRIRRLNSAHQGQGRVLTIYERAVNRHPGSNPLWKEHLEYTHKVKASKRFRRTMTNALRMIPTDPELWILAGTRSAQSGDMAASRGFFMRGCRFCTKDCRIWIEYARSEMEWLQKIDKRQAKGQDPLRTEKTSDNDFLPIAADSDDDDDDEDSNHLLPIPSAAQEEVIDKSTAKQLASNPAMDGAIPIAIFDISRKQGFFDANTGALFFETFGNFRGLSSQPKILKHVLDTLLEQYPRHPATRDCVIRQPILGLSSATADFPRNLREVLANLSENFKDCDDQDTLKRRILVWVDEYLGAPDLDNGIRAVLQHTKTKFL